jgi:hypothetical protein
MFKVYLKFCRQHGRKDPLVDKDEEAEEEKEPSQGELH